jgi:hypothetical protein
MVKGYGWLLGLVVFGCGSTDMTATGPKQTPRARDCSFDILTSTPSNGYKEIGTVDVTPGGYGVNVFTNLREFKGHIRETVCRLGGDAAIAYANGYGMYIKATVLKRVRIKAPSSVPSSEGRKRGGCDFDSQCKGDRICVEGKCQAPEPTESEVESESQVESK